MKKLLISAFAVVATLGAVDMNAGSCYKNSCRKETSCEKRCEKPAGKVCEREVIRHPRPEVQCRKWVPVDSCCNLKEITEIRYEPSCPPGFEQDGEAYIAQEGSHTTHAVASKEANNTSMKKAKTGKYAARSKVAVAE
jgi:hypothetical protein